MTTRRSFIKTSMITGATAAVMPALNATASAHDFRDHHMTEFYELRVYSLKNEIQQKLVEDYLSNAAIPALNRLGITNIGVFTELKPAGQTKIYVLTPFKNLNDFLKASDELINDAEYIKNGVGYLTATANEPAYERIESSLLKAFKHMPKLELPAKAARIFELRQYQSAGEIAGTKKIEMFNDEGEINIFKRLGFKPVFFAETIIGGLRPNLTYMVTFNNMEEHNSHWKAFGSDPEWKKVSSAPGYADSLLVSKITSTFIVPATFSQI